jgi:hypothetical protein
MNNNNNNNNSLLTSDINVIKRRLERYRNITTEVQRMWNMKRFVIPVITGVKRIVTKRLRNTWKQCQESIQRILLKKKKKKKYCTRDIAHNKEAATM